VSNYFLKSDTNSDGTATLKNTKFDVQAARMAISMYIVSGAHPFTTVEEDGFRSMMSACCPQFKNVSRRTIKREIMALFLSQKKRFLILLLLPLVELASQLIIGNLKSLNICTCASPVIT
jgi:hypothetical protein